MKIQVLELPAEYSGEYSITPYALIISEVPQASLDAVSREFSNFYVDRPGFPHWTYTTHMEVEL